MAWAPQVWEKLTISNYLRQVNSQQKSTKQKCDFCIKHLSGGTSKCRNARDSAKVALSWLGATWFWSDFFLTGFWPDSIYLIFDHIVCVWFCIYGMYIYTYIYICVKGLDIAVYIWDVLFFHVFNVFNVLNVRRRKRQWQKQWRPRPSMADVFHGAWNGMSTTSSTCENCPNVLTHSHIIIWN